MLERVNGVIADLKTNPPPLPVDEIAEAIQFLQWLSADHFTFLGVRDYKFDGHALSPDFDSALGIMRDRELKVLKRGDELLEFTPEIMAFLKEPRPLIIAKANIHAHVHRRVYLDYIGVKRFDAAGNLTGEFRIVGLFTSTAYTRSAHGIPYLRRKIAAVEKRAGFDPNSHSGKALANVLEHYPRDELFQVDEDTLYRFVLAIMQLDERPRVRVLRALRPLRPFRLGAGVRAARTLRQRDPRPASATIWRAPSSGGCRPSIRSSRKGRWCACISSSAAPAGRRRRSRAQRSSTKCAPSCAPGPTG